MAMTLEQLAPYVGKNVCMHWRDEDAEFHEDKDGAMGGVLLPGVDDAGYVLVDWGMGILPADITEIHLDTAPCSLYSDEDKAADQAAYYAEHAPQNGDLL